jgi:hypothetical protein
MLDDMPAVEVDAKVGSILATGEEATVPEDMLCGLNRRRLLAKQVAPWVVAHHAMVTVIYPRQPGE